MNMQCKYAKASTKINFLIRLKFSMTFDQGILVMSPFVQSCFSNFSMVSMFHSPKLNERINCSLESILRTVCTYFKRNQKLYSKKQFDT